MDPLHYNPPPPSVLPRPVGLELTRSGNGLGLAPSGGWATAVIRRALDVARVLTSADGACLACQAANGACYEAGSEGFRVWCAFCDHSTERYPDLDQARLEWWGSREVPNG